MTAARACDCNCGGAISYSITGAAAATGYGIDIIRRAIKAGVLEAHYPNSKASILAEDLRRWVAESPIDPPEPGERRR